MDAHLLCHLQHCLAAALPFSTPHRGLLLQLLDLFGHLGDENGECRPVIDPQCNLGSHFTNPHNCTISKSAYLLHFLPEGGEHLIAFRKRALEILKLVHVKGKLKQRIGGTKNRRLVHHAQEALITGDNIVFIYSNVPLYFNYTNKNE